MAQKILSVEVKGLDKVLTSLNSLKGDFAHELGAALYQEAQATITEALPITPIDLGPLRASAHVDPPQFSGGEVTVQCGFGGASAEYAEIQHENLEFRHNPPTQAKYLETPFNKRARDLDQRIAAKLKARLS